MVFPKGYANYITLYYNSVIKESKKTLAILSHSEHYTAHFVHDIVLYYWMFKKWQYIGEFSSAHVLQRSKQLHIGWRTFHISDIFRSLINCRVLEHSSNIKDTLWQISSPSTVKEAKHSLGLFRVVDTVTFTPKEIVLPRIPEEPEAANLEKDPGHRKLWSWVRLQVKQPAT